MRDVTSLMKRSALLDSLIRRPPGLYHRLRAEIAAEDRLPLEERSARQRTRLRAMVARATRAPHYAGLGELTDPDDIPLLDKAAIRADYRRFLAGSERGTSRATTSGSTGVPLVLRRSAYSVIYEQATVDHVIAQAGPDPVRARAMMLKADTILDADDHDAPFWRQVSPTSIAMSAPHLSRESWRDYAKLIRDFKPDILFAFTSAAELLVSYLEDGGERLSVPLCVTSCETPPEGLRARVRDRLGGAMLDIYGQAERVAFATALEDGDYRFRPDYGAVEFLPTEAGFELVSTGLRNAAQVFLRYRTGDVVDVGEARDTAALKRIILGIDGFRGVSGRTSEYIRRRDGSRIIGLNHMVRDIPGVASAQIVQRDFDRVEFIIIPAADFDEDCRAALMRRISAKLPASFRIEITLAESPLRTAAGKAPLFICDLGSAA
ncbi:MAG: hypothetical protein AB7L41_08480 [Flavobacteriaceae bacterium]